MCTVTYIPAGEKVFITSNRDEQRLRRPAAAPASYDTPTGRLLYPKDAQAGGSWLAVHERGHVLVLLNGAGARHRPQPPYRKSRGLILLELAQAVSPLRHFHALELGGCAPEPDGHALERSEHVSESGEQALAPGGPVLEAGWIEPFTLVLFQSGSLYECRWDGSKKTSRELDAGQPQIWSSVTLYEEAVVRRREVWFREWLRAFGGSSPDEESVLRFHRFAGDGDPCNDLLMNREGRMLTVSITSVSLHTAGAAVRYQDLAEGRETISRLLFTPAIVNQATDIPAISVSATTAPLVYSPKTVTL